MRPERWQRILELAEAASSIERERRPIYLANACGTDRDLLKEVEALLESDEHAGSFIEQPAVYIAKDRSAEDRRNLARGQRFGPYEILDLLGTGGMGEVHLAVDTRLGRKV